MKFWPTYITSVTHLFLSLSLCFPFSFNGLLAPLYSLNLRICSWCFLWYARLTLIPQVCTQMSPSQWDLPWPFCLKLKFALLPALGQHNPFSSSIFIFLYNTEHQQTKYSFVLLFIVYVFHLNVSAMIIIFVCSVYTYK